MITVAEVDALAARAHAGQLDKIGVDYIEHPRAVAAGLEPFGDELVMAGLLHDVLEDTDVTAADLLAAGVLESVMRIVEAVTNTPGELYEVKMRRIAADRDACLVKIADNASNSDRPGPRSSLRTNASGSPRSTARRAKSCGKLQRRTTSPRSSSASIRHSYRISTSRPSAATARKGAAIGVARRAAPRSRP